MLRIFGLTTLLPAVAGRSRGRLLPLVLSSAVILPSIANAGTIDFNVATGDFPTATNWNPATVPTVTDDAYVRNSGNLTVNADAQVLSLRIGASNLITNPDTTTTETGGPGTLTWTAGNITGNATGPVLPRRRTEHKHRRYRGSCGHRKPNWRKNQPGGFG